MKKFLFLTLLVCSSQSLAIGRIQNGDVKSLSDIQSSNGVATGNLSSISPCISSLSFSSGSYAHLAIGLFVYDSTTPGNIGAGVTIAGLPGSCSAGQVQMSSNASGTATGDTITFGGQKSQLINDTKLYVTANSINDTLFNAITNGSLGSTLNRTINNQTGSTYTLMASDGGAGRPILMVNSSGGTAVTVPPHSSVPFAVGTQVDVVQSGPGRVTMTPGGGVTFNSSGGNRTIESPYSLASLLQTSTDVWALIGQFSSLMTATGGVITTDGNFKVHTFISSGNFTVTSGSGPVDMLIVAGGGGGGGAGINQGGAGGGAGGLIYMTGVPFTMGVSPVTVGAAGAASPNNMAQGGDGGNSVFNGNTAIGGGGGDDGNQDGGRNGGSGGGVLTNTGPGLGTVGQGHNGGTGRATVPNYPAGGGGGAGTVGGNGDPTLPLGGVGGTGLSNSITGSPVFYAGGGGGATGDGGGTGGAGGNGGGGAGGSNTNGTAGTANTGGGGGGGGGGTSVGAAGGSGVVIVRYQFQ